MKGCLLSPPILAFFDPTLPSILQTDASRTNEFGFVLLQRNGKVWFLNDAELRYAVIKIELAAVLWTVKKCGTYLTGLPHFDLIVDHCPLVPILNIKLLSEFENPCLQRIRENLFSLCFALRIVDHSLHRPRYAASWLGGGETPGDFPIQPLGPLSRGSCC